MSFSAYDAVRLEVRTDNFILFGVSRQDVERDMGIDLSGKEIREINAESPYALLPVLSEVLQGSNAFVATGSEQVCGLCRTLNTFGEHKLAVWHNGALYAEELFAAFSKKIIRTVDDSVHILPQPTQYPGVFTSAEDGRILLKGSGGSGEALIDAGGTEWGRMLPAGTADIRGTLEDCHDTLDDTEREQVIRQLSGDACAMPGQIILFGTGEKLVAAELPDSEKTMNTAELELYLYTGLTRAASGAALMNALCKMKNICRAAELAGRYCTAAVFA